LVEAARYAAPGETGCFFPPARHGSGDRLADAPFTMYEVLKIQTKLQISGGGNFLGTMRKKICP